MYATEEHSFAWTLNVSRCGHMASLFPDEKPKTFVPHDVLDTRATYAGFVPQPARCLVKQLGLLRVCSLNSLGQNSWLRSRSNSQPAQSLAMQLNLFWCFSLLLLLLLLRCCYCSRVAAGWSYVLTPDALLLHRYSPLKISKHGASSTETTRLICNRKPVSLPLALSRINSFHIAAMPQRSTGADRRHPSLGCCRVTSMAFIDACSDSTNAAHILLTKLNEAAVFVAGTFSQYNLARASWDHTRCSKPTVWIEQASYARCRYFLDDTVLDKPAEFIQGLHKQRGLWLARWARSGVFLPVSFFILSYFRYAQWSASCPSARRHPGQT